MKIKVTFKDPDGVSESIRQAVEASVSEMEELSEDEREAVIEKRTESAQESLRKWIKHGEYLTVEFSTETRTATIITQ